ncbi:MAG: hypothetical protein DCF20_13600 [Pseudanabaena sp.]|nr:MAG: hypothetical protein DCF20_13600 [Pseudanabaena sp.]
MMLVMLGAIACVVGVWILLGDLFLIEIRGDGYVRGVACGVEIMPDKKGNSNVGIMIWGMVICF